MKGRRRRVLCISALKGGVGKTTTAVNLSAAAARAGRTVLLVDLDPQGSAASSMGSTAESGTGEWLLGDVPFDGLVERESRPGLDLMPAGRHLFESEDRLREKGRDKRKGRLARRLSEIDENAYDLVVLDCPPSLGLLLQNAYEAADEIILPAKLDFLSLPALDRTRLLVKECNIEREKPLRIAGVLPTFYDLRTHVSDDVLEAVRERFTKILSPIRINATLAEAPSRGQTIFDFDGSSRGAVDYSLLAEELKLA